jgi:3',5'-cyclic AMP phosphodiesterase CpdA
MGTYGCDTPALLMNTMLDHAQTIDTDVVLMSGDYAAHGISAYRGQKEHYELLKKTLTEVFSAVIQRFPDKPLIPAIGNNDPKWHNEFASDLTLASDYYNFLFKLWFTDHPVNSKYAKLEEIRTTFLQGGYYRYEVSDTIFVSLNSLYFDKDSSSFDHHGIDVQ